MRNRYEECSKLNDMVQTIIRNETLEKDIDSEYLMRLCDAWDDIKSALSLYSKGD